MSTAPVFTAEVIQLHNNQADPMPSNTPRISDKFKWAWSQKTGSSSYKAVLVALAEHANKDLKAWPSLTCLEVETELNERTVRKSLQALQEMGLIRDTGEKAGFTKQVPVYQLCLEVFVTNKAVKGGNLKTGNNCNPTVLNGANSTVVQTPVILHERTVILQAKGCNNVSKPLQSYSTESLEPLKEPLKESLVTQQTEKPLLQSAAQTAHLKLDLSPSPTTSTGSTELNRQVWAAYSQAYQQRYQAEPVRNAKINKQIANLVKNLGADAVAVAAWFVNHNSAYYIQRGHSIGNLLADCEKLRTEWATGRAMTTKTAYQLDNTQTNLNSFTAFQALVASKYGKDGSQ